MHCTITPNLHYPHILLTNLIFGAIYVAVTVHLIFNIIRELTE